MQCARYIGRLLALGTLLWAFNALAETPRRGLFPGIQQQFPQLRLPEELERKGIYGAFPRELDRRGGQPSYVLPDGTGDKSVVVTNNTIASLALQYWDGKLDWQLVVVKPGVAQPIICRTCEGHIFMAFHDGQVQRTFRVKLMGLVTIQKSPTTSVWQLIGGEEVALAPN